MAAASFGELARMVRHADSACDSLPSLSSAAILPSGVAASGAVGMHGLAQPADGGEHERVQSCAVAPGLCQPQGPVRSPSARGGPQLPGA